MTEHDHIRNIVAQFKEKIDWHAGLLELLCSCHFLNDDTRVKISLAIEHLIHVSENIHLTFDRQIAPGLTVFFGEEMGAGEPTSYKVIDVDRKEGMIQYTDGLCDTVEGLCLKLLNGEAKILPNSP